METLVKAVMAATNRLDYDRSEIVSRERINFYKDDVQIGSWTPFTGLVVPKEEDK